MATDFLAEWSDEQLLRNTQFVLGECTRRGIDVGSSKKPPPLSPFNYDPSTGEIRYGSSPESAGKRTEYRQFGEFLQTVSASSYPQAKVDERLTRASGLQEGVASEGGFLVSSDMTNEWVRSIFETDRLASRCTSFTISGGSNELKVNTFSETSRVDGSRLGGVRGYWIAEAGEKQSSKPDFRQVTLKPKKLVCLVYSSEELEADVEALGRIISEGCKSELGFQIDQGIVAGTGAGQMLGIMNSPAKITQAAETGQSSTDLFSDNLTKMYSRLLPGSHERAAWLVHSTVLPALYGLGITVGVGGSPIFMPGGGISGKPYDSIFGLPVLVTEQCQPLGTEGDIVLADLSQYLIARKGDLQSAVTAAVRFIYDELVYRFIIRIDGSPLLNSEITPFKGATTLSHFITLATR